MHHSITPPVLLPPSVLHLDIQAPVSLVLLSPNPQQRPIFGLSSNQVQPCECSWVYLPRLTLRKQSLFPPFFMFLGISLLFCYALTTLCHRAENPLHCKYLGSALISMYEWKTPWRQGQCLLYLSTPYMAYHTAGIKPVLLSKGTTRDHHSKHSVINSL